MTKHNAQIAIEFLLFVGMAFVVIFTLLAVALSVSESNTKTKTYYQLDDLGKSVQAEMFLASELEDGYTRKINLPMSLNELHYTVVLNQTHPENAFFTISYQTVELFYVVPPINGTLHLGDNTLRKVNGTLQMN